MAALMPQGKQQYFTAGGIPLVGGKVYTYAAGTTTPLATYTTAAASTPNTNPVILDSRGEASIFFSAANYKIVMKDSLDSTIWTQDNLPGDQAATILANLAASTGSSLVGYLPAGTGAVATTVQEKLRESVSVKDFGAVGDGVADDTAALNNAAAAANGYVNLDGGKTYKVTSQLNIPSTCLGFIGRGMYTSVLSKAFNGDLIKCDSNGAVFQHFGIVGNGATYTGGGIRPRGYNILIQHCRIADTADCPVIVEDSSVSGAQAATYLCVDSCFLQGTSAATYAARLVTPDGTAQGTDASTRPTCRVFSNISGGAPLVDFSGMNFATLNSSLGASVKFNADSSKINMTGNRITSSGASVVIYGEDHIIDGNMWGFNTPYAVSIDATASNVYFGPMNNIVTDSSNTNTSVTTSLSVGAATTHNIFTKQAAYTPTWKGSTSDWVVGNGSIIGNYVLSGRMCLAAISIVRGSSTTNAVGATWSFTLPFKAAGDYRGAALVKSSTGTHYVGTFAVFGGIVGYIYLDTTAAVLGDGVAPAMSTNSTMSMSLTYAVATS